MAAHDNNPAPPSCPIQAAGIGAARFAALVLITIGLSALLTPIVYSGIDAALGPIRYPFSRVFDRVAMVVVAVLILIYRRELSLAEVSRYFRRGAYPQKLRRFAFGFAVSLAAVGAALPPIAAQSGLEWTVTPELLLKLCKIVPAAILISLIEEGFFRVIVLGRLRRALPAAAAALFCSLLYSVVHFIAPVKSFVYESFAPLAGFSYLAVVAGRFAAPGFILPFFGLLLVSLVLCYVMMRTGSLFLCVGLHTGWVVGMKVSKHIAPMTSETKVLAGVGDRYFLVSQPIAWLSIVLVFLIVALAIKRWSLLRGIDGSE